MYVISRTLIKNFVCKVLFRVKYENADVLNKIDKCLICPNHSRMFDPVFLYPKVDHMYSMAKSELFKHKLFADYLTYHNVFPVDREHTDAASLRKAIKLIKTNAKIKLLIFPEGRVIKNKSEYGDIKCGAVYIAALTGVPIVPVQITPRANYFSKVIVKFGKPIYYDKEDTKDKDLIEQRSKELLEYIYDEKYRCGLPIKK